MQTSFEQQILADIHRTFPDQDYCDGEAFQKVKREMNEEIRLTLALRSRYLMS